ncbi:MAG: YhgE/Pip domain-containing protein [Lachnospiraceae bacterium]|jgi:putative membrane protein|nr:YhgE/Pip domain-containing protein [Lachnospiraceae bacterium]
MRNILRVFRTDAGRIANNVVGFVVIMGLCVLPSLYAWFNIFSNWDPYGESATGRMQIAVCSNDLGQSLAGKELNIGGSVVEGLKSNRTIGWVFEDNDEKAVEGVYDGSYYAAIIIPESFTEDVISFMSGEVKHPTIVYYENDKKNAIAPKITGKAKTAVQQQINATFIATVAGYLTSGGELLASENGSNQTILDVTIEELTDLRDDLQTVDALFGSMVAITEAVDAMGDLGSSAVAQAETVGNQSAFVLQELKDLTDVVMITENTSSGMVSTAISEVKESITSVQNGLAKDESTIIAKGDEALQELKQYEDLAKSAAEVLKYAGEAIKDYDENAAKSLEEISKQLDALKETIQKIQSSQSVDEIKNLLSQSQTISQNAMDALTKLETEGLKNLDSSMQKAITDSKDALDKAANALTDLGGDKDKAVSIVEEYGRALDSGKLALKQSKQIIDDMISMLNQVIDRLSPIQDSAEYQKVKEILSENPDQIGEFISSPVSMKTEAIYPIKSYGSAMTPFYSTLALWVGALILVAIIHVKVEPIEGVVLKSYQSYFGRYILFFLVGQIQTLITVLGNLFYIKIQCPHPFMFWFAASFTSFTYTIFIYSLTVAFENVGEALAVVIMVVQVAGAGGTFPIETLPKVYQAVYRFLPFNYSMNAMRETIGGLYENAYLEYLLKLGIFVLVSLFIGLVLHKPFEKLNHMIEKSKEKTGLMI